MAAHTERSNFAFANVGTELTKALFESVQYELNIANTMNS